MVSCCKSFPTAERSEDRCLSRIYAALSTEVFSPFKGVELFNRSFSGRMRADVAGTAQPAPGLPSRLVQDLSGDEG